MLHSVSLIFNVYVRFSWFFLNFDSHYFLLIILDTPTTSSCLPSHINLLLVSHFRNAYFKRIYSIFRDKSTFNVFNVELTELFNWAINKYPDDEELKGKFQTFGQKYAHLPMDVFTKELKRANSQTTTIEAVRKRLRESFNEARRITGEYEINISSEEACVSSFKELQALIISDKKNILLNSAKQGQVLKHLKSNMRGKGSFVKCIQTNEIMISLSYCNFLISFSELANQYPQIVQCSLELKYIMTHLKQIKLVIAEVFNA